VKKTITIAGGTYIPDWCDEHSHFVVTVSQELFARIQQMAALVKQYGLYAVEQFDWSCEPYPCLPTRRRTAYDVLTVDRSELQWLRRGQPCPEPSRADYMMLIVTDDSVRWNWVPKHGNGRDLCSTHDISIEDLQRAFEAPAEERK
jgi:hypothetical protein